MSNDETRGVGRPRKIESPKKLWQYFCDYRDEKKADPIIVIDFKGKDAVRCEMPHQRPLTLDGFESWCFEKEIINDLGDYFSNKDGRYEEFSTICSHIRKIIRTDQIEGGMCGIYNPSITQRLNGLVDKTESKVVVEQPLFDDEPDDCPEED